MGKVTENMKGVVAKLNDLGGVAFARQVFDNMEGKTFNGVNATLAAAVAKGYCTKEKALFEAEGSDPKMLTKYTITDAGRAMLEEVDSDEDAEEVVEEEVAE